jgi:hypothetical protein
MKKILSVLAVLAVASAAFAQGTINFGNNASTAVMYTDAVTTTPTAVPANGGFVGLIYANAGTAGTFTGGSLATWLTANPGWALLDYTKAINLAGRFTSATVTLPTANPVDMIVIGWKGTATSFDAALAAGDPTGASVKFTIDPEAIGSTTPSPSIVTAGFAGMTLTSVPEPSTFALAGLGAAALLIFRRRK